MTLFSSSINLGLPQLPSIPESHADTYEELLRVYAAIQTLLTEATQSTRVICTFDETVTAGQAVSFYTVAGTLRARLADATDNTRPCVGFSTYATSATATGEVQCTGLNINLSGLTPGALYYLSETSGAITATKPVGAGKIVQPIGWAISTTTLLFNPNNNWTQL